MGFGLMVAFDGCRGLMVAVGFALDVAAVGLILGLRA